MSHFIDDRINSTPTSPETFCHYLAKQFVAKKGFQVESIVPEAANLVSACDVALSHFDGFSLTIVCLVSRETDPKKTFAITAAETKAIGKDCLAYSGRVNGVKMPTRIFIFEIGNNVISDDQKNRLQQYKSGMFSKAIVASGAVDVTSGELWTNAKLGRWNDVARFIQKILNSPYENIDAQQTPIQPAENKPATPLLTGAIIAVLSLIFLSEVSLGGGSWVNNLQPTIPVLVDAGGLARSLIFGAGEWHRLFSAPLLHANFSHLLMNAFALFVAGRTLESLVGRAWLGVIFSLGALTGALFSLAMIPDRLLSVGASGAVMALFSALLVLGYRYPPGPDRTALFMTSVYVLIPSLLPLAALFKGGNVDYAAHLGGALCGVAIGFLFLKIWPKEEALPPYRQSAAGVAMVGLLAGAYALLPLIAATVTKFG